MAREPARHGADDGGGDAYPRLALRDVDGPRGRAVDADRVRLGRVGYLIEPRGASCKVTHVSCVAPGDAPAFLVNRLAWQRTAMVLKVRALVAAGS